MIPAPTIILNGPEAREKAARWARGAPFGTAITYKAPKRTVDQNAKVHAMITEVAQQIEWAGKKRDVEAWKDIFTAALLSATHELDVVPGINGGFVLLGLHTSSLTKAQCIDLITLIEMFGAEHGVVFSDGNGGWEPNKTPPIAAPNPKVEKAWRPSNATDGMQFMAEWCCRCACDEIANGRDEDGNTCPILDSSFLHGEEDGDYPPQLVETTDGPRCTAFVLYVGQEWCDPKQVERDQGRYDALPRDPATGRPVIR